MLRMSTLSDERGYRGCARDGKDDVTVAFYVLRDEEQKWRCERDKVRDEL